MIMLLMGLALAGESWCGSEDDGLRADRGWRPSVSGDELLLASDSGLFLAHYTLQGDDVPRGGDQNQDGVPDMVPRMLNALDDARVAFEADGWRALHRDDGEGGDNAIDVYITQIDAYGYANATATESGDGWSCFLRLDPDLPSLGGTVVESVSAHELHHCVQYTYTSEAAPWMYESQATLEQYRIDDNAASDLFVDILWIQRLAEPERGLDQVGDRFEYAGFTFPKFWEEFQGGTARMPDVWEQLALDPDWQRALNLASQDAFGQPFADTFLDYSVYNGFACALDDGAHYAPKPAGCSANASVPIVEVTGDTFEVDLAGLPYTSMYVEIPAAGSADTVAISCEGLDLGADLRVAVVARDALGVGGELARGVREAALVQSMTPDGSALVVLASVGTAAVRATCTVERVAVVETPAGGCACAGASSPWSAWWLAVPLLVVRRRGRQ